MKKIIVLISLLSVLFITGCREKMPARESVWSDPEMWYKSESVFDTSKTDVLYLVSTEVLSAKDKDGNVSWQSMLAQEDRAAISAEMAWVEKNMFDGEFNFSSPYYHQFTFDAICKLNEKQMDSVYKNVRSEVCEAFDYYMKHVNNGRRFILAGFSQGAMLTLDLLRHMTDEQYSRMIACYTIGYRITAEDLQSSHIKAATGENDKGVVISFNSTQTREAIWHLLCDGAVTCINPLNWKTDSTPATFFFDGTTNTAHVDPETNVILVETDNPQYYYSFYEAAPFFMDAGVNKDNLHHWDLLFYNRQIHDNALVRASN